MIIVLFIWLIVGFNFLVIGFSGIKIIGRFSKKNGRKESLKPDELFFLGFLLLSAITGLLSIWMPVGKVMLIFVSIISVLVFILNFKGIKAVLAEFRLTLSSFSRIELFLLSFVILFILCAVAQKITLGDTESYHAQSIQWIRKYAVVPGLGNIHGRFAFNSMFFVISGLFTFQFKDVVIYPLNGICYSILVFKLAFIARDEYIYGKRWISIFCLLVMLLSLLMFLPDLNSPAPDIICGILVIYALISIISKRGNLNALTKGELILLNFVIFTCVSYKLSSFFLICAIIFLLRKDLFSKVLMSLTIGMLVLSSFLIRNYYLSGYLVYPYPAADFFSINWKIPLNNVISMKMEIQNWARIASLPVKDVAAMSYAEWIPVWFMALDFNRKLLLIVNLLSICTSLIMIFRKDYFFLLAQAIIFLNLLFWLNMAPDLRFAYGFLITGFALTLAYVISLFDDKFYSDIYRYMRVGLIFLLLVVAGWRITYLTGTIKNPSLWAIPAPYGKVETKEYFSGFKYRVPVTDNGCFNEEIPCVPYPLENIVLRGNSLQDGFMVCHKQTEAGKN